MRKTRYQPLHIGSWAEFDSRDAEMRSQPQPEYPTRHLTNRRWGRKLPIGWLWDRRNYIYLGEDFRILAWFDHKNSGWMVEGTPPVARGEYNDTVEYPVRRLFRWLDNNFPRDRHPAQPDPLPSKRVRLKGDPTR